MKSSTRPQHLQPEMILLLRLAIAWLGFLLLWFLFVFQLTWAELIVGAFSSAATVAAAYVAFRAVPACFEPRLHWIAQVWRLPVLTVTDLWLLLKHLGREMIRKPSLSSFKMTTFRSTSEECQAAAQRALAILFVSTAPNSVVLDIDCEKGQMLFHELQPAPVGRIVRELQN